jgi:hypothetical protein
MPNSPKKLTLDMKQGRFVPTPEFFDVNSLDDLVELLGADSGHSLHSIMQARRAEHNPDLKELLKRIRGLPKKMKARVKRG